MREELYVYYKVESAYTALARAAFDRLRDCLNDQWPGLHSRLLMRPAVAGAMQTWMEIHTWPDGGAEAPIDWVERLEHLASQAVLPGARSRHVEVFVALG